MAHNKTRFDLEEAIMNLWSSDQDVDTLFKYYYDRQGEVDVRKWRTRCWA